MMDRFNRNVTQAFLTSMSEPANIAEPLVDKVEGFMRVGLQTSIPPSELRPIAIEWAAGEHAGRRNNTALVAKALCAFSWSWEAFDLMVKVLLGANLWPMPWHHYEKKIKAGAALEDVKAKIFIQSARTAAASVKRSKDSSFRAILSLGGWHLYTDSEVGASLLNHLVSRVDPNNPDTWPPLYPGDLSGIRDGLEGVYSRYGQYRPFNPNLPHWAR